MKAQSFKDLTLSIKYLELLRVNGMRGSEAYTTTKEEIYASAKRLGITGTFGEFNHGS